MAGLHASIIVTHRQSGHPCTRQGHESAAKSPARSRLEALLAARTCAMHGEGSGNFQCFCESVAVARQRRHYSNTLVGPTLKLGMMCAVCPPRGPAAPVAALTAYEAAKGGPAHPPSCHA